MTTGREPLTREERELAARLARLGAPDGPPAALDARILAAAHDELLRAQSHAPASRRPRSRRRWPLAIGAAASLVVVLGIAWQLRPAQESRQVYSEADAARAPHAAGPSAAEELPMAGVVANEPAMPQAAPPAPPAPPPPADAAADAVDAAAGSTAAAEPDLAMQPNEDRRERGDMRQDHARDAFPAEPRTPSSAPPAATARAPAPTAPPPEQPAENDIVFDAPAAVAAPAPPAPPPASTAAVREAAAVQQRRQAVEKTRTEESAALDRIEVTGARIARDNEGFTDQELDDLPPATADSTQVQRAWLQRIREMLAEGDKAGARASLAEFKRRNPRYALPEDLQALLP